MTRGGARNPLTNSPVTWFSRNFAMNLQANDFSFANMAQAGEVKNISHSDYLVNKIVLVVQSIHTETCGEGGWRGWSSTLGGGGLGK